MRENERQQVIVLKADEWEKVRKKEYRNEKKEESDY